MAYDDYWRWRYSQDDRIWRENLASENSSKLHEALLKQDWDEAIRRTGMPPRKPGYERADEPDPTHPPTAGEQFREHKQALLFNLEWVYDFLLPEALCQDWARRVAPLDIEESEAGLAVIEAIRDEYERAVHRYEPPNSEVSRRIEWDYRVPRVGHEMEWVERLFRHVLSFR